MLHGGAFVRLLPEQHPGLNEVKWSMNRFQPFLVISPEVRKDGWTRAQEHTHRQGRLTLWLSHPSYLWHTYASSDPLI